ncbi:MAG: dTMP kinase [Alphaproteobacteria bacterium]
MDYKMRRGLFITFEGGEGSGKSTQIKLFAAYLSERGFPYVLTREPGGSEGGEEIRNLLLKGSINKWDKVTEILLFSAARRDHLIKKIYPALAAGQTVISDRFADSTLAYQGYGYGMDEEAVRNVQVAYRMIAGDFEPDITFILDINPEIGVARSLKRAGNDEQRFENMDLTFHHNLREAFLKIARENPHRCIVIQADQSVEQVHNEIIRQFEKIYP